MLFVVEHAQALQSNNPDQYLPVSHTCFFQLELPKYSRLAILRSKLLFAIRNCASIDGDHTHEARQNLEMKISES